MRQWRACRAVDGDDVMRGTTPIEFRCAPKAALDKIFAQRRVIGDVEQRGRECVGVARCDE